MMVLNLVQSAGIPGYVIVLLGIISLAIIFERVSTLYFKFSKDSKSFIYKIKILVQKDKYDQALAFCDANKRVPTSYVVKEILTRSNRDDESIFQGLDIGLNKVSSVVNRRSNHLLMLANVATLVGLLGTIIGLIQSFASVAMADQSMKEEALSNGISLAMNTTAMGLSVAIPVMIAASVLMARQEKILEDCDTLSSLVVDEVRNRLFKS